MTCGEGDMDTKDVTRLSFNLLSPWTQTSTGWLHTAPWCQGAWRADVPHWAFLFFFFLIA